jgi:hypothetical protein
MRPRCRVRGGAHRPGHTIRFQEADAENPPPEASFDVVLSTLGDVHPEPEQGGERARARLHARRQDRPRKLTPESHRLPFKTIGKYIPPAPGLLITGARHEYAAQSLRRNRVRSERPAASLSSATVRRHTDRSVRTYYAR